MSVLFFPEGTRSEDGKIKDFQNGAFKLAIKEKVPVLPIAIRGNRSRNTQRHLAIPDKDACQHESSARHRYLGLWSG